MFQIHVGKKTQKLMLFKTVEITLESEIRYIFFIKSKLGIFSSHGSMFLILSNDDGNDSDSDIDLRLCFKESKLISKVVDPQIIIFLLDLESLFPELGGVSVFLMFFVAQFVLHWWRNEN